MSELSDNAAIVASPSNAAGEWLAEIARANKKYGDWHTKGDKVIARYKDERTDREIIQDARGRKMNLLWSNVETLAPALFNQVPTPNVSRRNKDADPVGRWASIVLERCIEASLDGQDFPFTMEQAIKDLLLPGMGVAIEEYVPTVEAVEAESTADLLDESDEAAEPEQKVTQQRSVTRYIHWKDVLFNPARIWDEIWWFGYRAYLTRAEVKAKFGAEIGEAIELDHKQAEGSTSKTDNGKDDKATVWTIWDKRTRKVWQVSPGYTTGLLGDMDPPVKFDNFWPIPRPLRATTASDSFLPSPDFAFYQDQADEIDLLTNRIYKLSESLRLRGLYPADMDSVKRLLSDASDTELIPVESWAMLMDKGGANNLVAWFPLKEVAQTLVWCSDAREKAKQALYEVTGMGDIIRGATDAAETATAQQIKSQWGSLRVRNRQRDIQRFARDVIRLKAEVIAEHFTLETLQEMSGVKLLTDQQKQTITQFIQMQQVYQQQVQQAQQQGLPVPPQPGVLTMAPPTPEMLEAMQEPSWEAVMKLLRDNKLRGFSIDVETDSTVEPDQMMEQQKAVQFGETLAQILTVSGPILLQQPAAAPMLGEILMSIVRRFKAGETVETSIEKFVATVQQQSSQPKPPDPKQQAEQVKAQTAQIGQQVAQVKAQTDIATAQIGQQTAQVKAEAEQTKAQLEVVQTVTEHQTTMAEKRMDAEVAKVAAAKPQAAE